MSCIDSLCADVRRKCSDQVTHIHIYIYTYTCMIHVYTCMCVSHNVYAYTYTCDDQCIVAHVHVVYPDKVHA